MLAIFQIVLPVFMVIAFGYFITWAKFIKDDQIDVLNYYAQTFAIPALLFSAVASIDMAATFSIPLLAAYYLPAIVIFLIGAIFGRFVFGRTPAQSVAVGFTVMFSNTLLLGLPIMERAYGAESLSVNFAIISVHAPIMYFIGITSMEILRADGRGSRATIVAVLKAIFKNALAIGIMLGFAVNFSGFAIPDLMEQSIEMISRSALPVALVGLGGVMVRYNLTSNLPEVGMIAVVKLLLFPALCYVTATYIFDLPTSVRNTVVLTGAMAPGINAFIFANMYQRAQQTAATSTVLCTIISVVTVSGWLAFLSV